MNAEAWTWAILVRAMRLHGPITEVDWLWCKFDERIGRYDFGCRPRSWDRIASARAPLEVPA